MKEAIGIAQGKKEETYGQYQEQNNNLVSRINSRPGEENSQVNGIAQEEYNVQAQQKFIKAILKRTLAFYLLGQLIHIDNFYLFSGFSGNLINKIGVLGS